MEDQSCIHIGMTVYNLFTHLVIPRCTHKYINMHVRCFLFNLDDSCSENEIDIDGFIVMQNMQCLDFSGNFKDRVTQIKDGKLSYEVVKVAKEFSCGICISFSYLHIYNTVSQVWHHWNECSYIAKCDIGPCTTG